MPRRRPCSEGGVRRGTFGPYEAGDVFRVQAAGGVVSYARNGVVFYTSSAAAPVFPLLLDTSLRTPGATIEAVSLVEIPGPAVVFDNSEGAFVWTPTWDSDDGFEQGAFLDLRHPAAEQTGEPSRSAIEFVKDILARPPLAAASARSMCRCGGATTRCRISRS